MTDYYRLVARAVADLKNADATRRAALYGCARAALVNQLTGFTPPLDESELGRRCRIDRCDKCYGSTAAEAPRSWSPADDEAGSFRLGAASSSQARRERNARAGTGDGAWRRQSRATAAERQGSRSAQAVPRD